MIQETYHTKGMPKNGTRLHYKIKKKLELFRSEPSQIYVDFISANFFSKFLSHLVKTYYELLVRKFDKKQHWIKRNNFFSRANTVYSEFFSTGHPSFYHL